MTAHQRALVGTAMVVGIIAIIFAIATVWPPIVGYALLCMVIGVFLIMIYGAFRMFYEHRNGH